MGVRAAMQTLLIVDDAKENIHILAELLGRDFIIRAATSGEKALDIAFSGNPPDLILLDVMMPEMDGYEVCRRLKRSDQTKAIPVIFITVKVSEEDEIYGFTLGAVDYISKPFSEVVVRARVGMHAELKRHRDYLESISHMDDLTGIANRRKFNEFLDYAWSFAEREQLPISMIMADIDHFKQYNDHYGHQQGDACLVRIAQALNDVVVRETDIFARYGGEEFACILTNTGMEGAWIIAENLRLKTMSLRIPQSYPSDGCSVSISLGVATMTPDRSTTCQALTKAADDALYRSKESGRNKVSL
jgi:diguanylate cyclase (GGDEF)-like protein